MANLRTNQVTRYRRFIVETMIEALRAAFDEHYFRDRQFADLKITNKYPLQKVGYPAIVLEYIGNQVVNAGVAHEEWFDDENGILRKWNHRRYEGTLNLDIVALSPLDRDMLADAIIELISFGRLDSQLAKFAAVIYGTDADPVKLIFEQIMLNTDIITERGNSATVAPWQPEDVLVYSAGISSEIHGGFYNTYAIEEWGFVKGVHVSPYPQGEENVDLPFNEQPGPAPTNPNIYDDEGTVKGRAEISSIEAFNP